MSSNLIAPPAATPPLSIAQNPDGSYSNQWTSPWQQFFSLLGEVIQALQQTPSGYIDVAAGTSPFQPDFSTGRSFRITLGATGTVIDTPANMDLAAGQVVIFILVQPGNCPGPVWDSVYAGVQVNDPFTVDPGVSTYSSLAFLVTDSELVLIVSSSGAHWPG